MLHEYIKLFKNEVSSVNRQNVSNVLNQSIPNVRNLLLICEGIRAEKWVMGAMMTQVMAGTRRDNNGAKLEKLASRGNRTPS
jgi:hypothetical protein